ncbi:hypothetical protein C8J55DRAFT_501636 [Lentinula edodes]|uniref:Transmembrane protein n=1 Tax=Lentinula lateritia TaxID=40482 RepID=A0A9W9AYK2_9AGAR|nr:hypothetical protein C8J55DRAFT_501636 [Lentinula edodes]
MNLVEEKSMAFLRPRIPCSVSFRRCYMIQPPLRPLFRCRMFFLSGDFLPFDRFLLVFRDFFFFYLLRFFLFHQLLGNSLLLYNLFLFAFLLHSFLLHNLFFLHAQTGNCLGLEPARRLNV